VILKKLRFFLSATFSFRISMLQEIEKIREFHFVKKCKLGNEGCPETDAIFEEVHRANREADETEGVLRLSMDAKATVKLGPFSRGGRNRSKVGASDHDFGSTGALTPFNILLPQHDELFISVDRNQI
jgi:hypothetical protein